jgi:hypothetical protein
MGSGNMITLIHFTPKFQGTSIEYHGTSKAHENEMDAWKYNEGQFESNFEMKYHALFARCWNVANANTRGV